MVITLPSCAHVGQWYPVNVILALKCSATDVVPVLRRGGVAASAVTMSANRWRRALAAGGRPALISKGPAGARCRLGPTQLTELQDLLDAGPAAWGLGRPVLDAAAHRRGRAHAV